ncbi:transcriptional adapter 3-like [Oscarella lobularis]|uniref:transcriptional adapter 3-like n=1 Tax=Oscarella lobularis TaxID=121494 RepID=UPI003314295E
MDLGGPPIHYCDFSLADHVQCCPKYTTLLGRKDGSVQADELSALQTDIEALLGAAHQRMKLLQNEFQLMNEWQDRRERKKLAKSQKRILSPPGEGRSVKKQKGFDSTAASAYDDELAIYQRPKAESLHRFWGSVEPYCRDITEDDIVTLNDVLSRSDEQDYFTVPPLGKPYAERWAHEDLMEEQRDGSRVGRQRGNTVADVTPNWSTTDKMLKQAVSANSGPSDVCPLGPLTQRLLAALVDENPSYDVPEKLEEDGQASPLKVKSEQQKMTGRGGGRTFSIPHVASLEARLKEELAALGVIDEGETKTAIARTDDDEILTELKQKQDELKAVMAYNRRQKDVLLKAAREEMQRQAIRRQIQELDDEILDVYKRLMTCKARKKALSKKEKDAAWKTLRERQRLVSLYSSN